MLNPVEGRGKFEVRKPLERVRPLGMSSNHNCIPQKKPKFFNALPKLGRGEAKRASATDVIDKENMLDSDLDDLKLPPIRDDARPPLHASVNPTRTPTRNRVPSHLNVPSRSVVSVGSLTHTPQRTQSETRDGPLTPTEVLPSTTPPPVNREIPQAQPTYFRDQIDQSQVQPTQAQAAQVVPLPQSYFATSHLGPNTALSSVPIVPMIESQAHMTAPSTAPLPMITEATYVSAPLVSSVPATVSSGPSAPLTPSGPMMQHAASIAPLSVPAPVAAPPTVQEQAPKQEHQRIMVNKSPYYLLEQIGSGGSSKVFKVVARDKRVYALKRIKLSSSSSSHVANYRNEIALLRRLYGKPHVVQLLDCEEDLNKGIILMVMEMGEIDLSRYLKRRRAALVASVAAQNEGNPGMNAVAAGANVLGSGLTANEIRWIWNSILLCVHTCHEEKVIHLDLKPPNFVIVEGQLKIIDFGIAKEFGKDTTNIIRDSQVGTVNYMSPESLADSDSMGMMGAHAPGVFKLGRSTDVWSLGCILYQLVYGATPFCHLPLLHKLRAISDPSFVIPFPEIPVVAQDPLLHRTLTRCLIRDSKERPLIDDLLRDPYLRPLCASPVGIPAVNPFKKLSENQSHQLFERLKQAVTTARAAPQGALTSGPGVSDVVEAVRNLLRAAGAPEHSLPALTQMVLKN